MRTTPLGRESRDAVEKLSRAETSDTFDSDILGQFPSEVEDSRPVVSVEVQRRQAEVDRIRDDNGLRKRVCTWSLVIVSAQLLVCNVGIIVYGVATVVSGGTIPCRGDRRPDRDSEEPVPKDRHATVEECGHHLLMSGASRDGLGASAPGPFHLR